MQPSAVFQVEIRTKDIKRAMAFYGAVFDWRIFPNGPYYALVDAGSMPVIGILQDPRLPLGIANNILVDDCGAAGERATALGGRVVVTKSEVPGSGLFVGTLDPWGNELFFWQPYSAARPALKGTDVNPITFFEIATPDVPGAIKYYNELVGWSFWNVVFSDNYAMSENGELRRGIGICGVGPGVHGTTDYVEVPNLEETAAAVTKNGGQILIDPTDFPGEGKFIVFADPDGNRMGAVSGKRV